MTELTQDPFRSSGFLEKAREIHRKVPLCDGHNGITSRHFIQTNNYSLKCN